MLAGGICCVPDEQVRHWQRREDAAAEAAWPKGQHTLLRVMVVLVRVLRGICASAKKHGVVSRSMESVMSKKKESDATLQFIECVCCKIAGYASLEGEHVIKARFKDMIVLLRRAKA